VEYAGALSELIHGPLVQDYRTIDFQTVRIILVEAAEQLIADMPEAVRVYTLGQLKKMGIEVLLGVKVLEVTEDGVILSNQNRLFSRTVVWTAGVRGESVVENSNLPAGYDGRVPVLPTLQAPGFPEIYVIGDLASIREGDRALPLVAQVAIQSALSAAKNILRHIDGQPLQSFRYRDRGSMITIGRNNAGVVIGAKTYTGFFAWILWLVIHLVNLVGFRNRIMVLINWAWDYLLYERAVRFVFPSEIRARRDKRSCCK
jgi:NADH dehydrogenase